MKRRDCEKLLKKKKKGSVLKIHGKSPEFELNILGSQMSSDSLNQYLLFSLSETEALNFDFLKVT